MKQEKKQQAIILRKQGKSIKSIAKELKVSISSVSIWTRNIILTDEQINSLKNNNPIFNNQISGAKSRETQARYVRKQYQETGKLMAKQGNLLHQAGCMLYWAEGSKSKNNCNITNTDINLLKLFKKFIVECFGVSQECFTISINYYTNNELTQNDIEQYWLNGLGLHQSSIRKGQENKKPRSATTTIRYNKHPFGICRLSVKGGTSIVQHIYGAIQEYAGFSNDYMLL